MKKEDQHNLEITSEIVTENSTHYWKENTKPHRGKFPFLSCL